MEREQKNRLAVKEAAFARQEAMIAKMQRFIDRFGTHLAKAAQAQRPADFDGTMLSVSHDRGFLRGLATKVLDVSPCVQGKAPFVYPGSYVEWVERTGTKAPGVHR